MNLLNPTASSVAIALTAESGEHVSRQEVIDAANWTGIGMTDGRVNIAGFERRIPELGRAVVRLRRRARRNAEKNALFAFRYGAGKPVLDTGSTIA